MQLFANAITLNNPASGRRTYQPVRRDSYLKGQQGAFYRPIERQHARRIVLAARKFEVTTRHKGQRNGDIGTIAIEVLDYLANLIDPRTGRLEPSIQTIMDKLHRSRDAVVRALSALRQHGFLDWIRRYEPTGEKGKGVQVQQTSNAYRLFMPNRALKLLGRYVQKSPVPIDIVHADQQTAAIFEEYCKDLPLGEKSTMQFNVDDPLGQVLARLGNLVEERESAKQTESLSKDSLNRKISPDDRTNE